jgi:Protein of unknown function (DUF1501)
MHPTQTAAARLPGRLLRRREWLQVGFSAFAGIGCQALLPKPGRAESTQPAKARAKSLILVYLTGGASHHDTFDMKPQASAEIRGPFTPIHTAVPGLQICEHLPRLAQCADRFTIVRSMSHEETSHPQATHRVLTGALFPPERNADPTAGRTDFPCYGAVLQSLRPPTPPSNDGIPAGVTLPTLLWDGEHMWPGQNAGFLGAKYDPWQLRQDPNAPNFREETLSIPKEFTPDRVASRRNLLAQVNAHAAGNGRLTDRGFSGKQQFALDLLTSGSVSRAFQLEREPAAVRDRYGRHLMGQSLLLARRLVTAGVSIVQVNMGPVQHWDTHVDNFRRLKQDLLPPFDQGLAALLEDLHASGRLDETLVVVTGEFGRTPKISTMPGQTSPGRDHWSSVFTALFAGPGIPGGRTLGQSDDIGAFPKSRAYSLYDLGATIYTALGLNPDTEIRDQFGRPVPLSRGKVMSDLYTGADF